MNRESIVLGVFLVCLLLIVGRSCGVASEGFTPFVEANVLQHFVNQLDGVDFAIGEAVQPPPTDEKVRRAFADSTRVSLSQHSLVSSDFLDTQCQFYLFVKGASDKDWLIINKAQTDYEGEKKVWLARLNEGLLTRAFSAGSRVEKVVILGAAGNQKSPRFSDREVVETLPNTLRYTRIHTIYLRRR
jgi:hypothetical protein